jgi:hypothetical protein
MRAEQLEPCVFCQKRDAVLAFAQFPRIYIDSIQLSLREPVSITQREHLKKSGARDVVLERSKHKGRRFNLRIHQPNASALADATALCIDHMVNRIDIAVDFPTLDLRAAITAQEFLRNHLTQRRHGCSHILNYRRTIYFRPAWKRRNIVIYPESASRHDGKAGVHLEFRFYGRAACRKLGVFRLVDVGKLNLPEIAAEQCRLSLVDVERVMRRVAQMVAQMEGKHAMRGLSSGDDLRSKVLGVIAHATQSECGGAVLEDQFSSIPAQEFIDSFPRLLRRAVTHIPLIKEANWPPHCGVFLQ